MSKRYISVSIAIRIVATRHLADKITAVDLADLIKVSMGQLFRAFKISVGVTPFNYLARRRVELACSMMRTTREPQFCHCRAAA